MGTRELTRQRHHLFRRPTQKRAVRKPPSRLPGSTILRRRLRAADRVVSPQIPEQRCKRLSVVSSAQTQATVDKPMDSQPRVTPSQRG
jgi:hypothetical protein